ncbi:uncharacterized protein LOC128558951 [Mercenaria mercenaria]|uniref:uncharacterized protein LOC128558951 n=1 Tax=Mercenaria mercenaria TaxID=6596 RepID=UPI00234F5697|nr:uncharacterized protein LOC128558951 [Mercenaria mercenaria]
MKFHNCVVCNTRTKPKNRRPVNKSIKKYLLKKFFINADERSIICNKCRHNYYIAETQRSSTYSSTEASDPDFHPPASKGNSSYLSPPSVSLKIPCTTKTHAKCFLCKRPGPKLIVVPSETRVTVFIKFNILIPSGSRCCPVHIYNEQISEESLINVLTTDTVFMSRTNILELIGAIRKECIRTNERLNFDNLREADYKELTGLKQTDFEDLFLSIEEHIRSSPVRSPRTTVGLFLLKLKSGISNKLLSTILGITPSSVRRAISSVRRALMQHFVPVNLGLAHISRQEIIDKHTRPLAQSLFGTDESGDSQPKMMLVLDGTYVYIQKSTNFQFQRRSFSMHKGRPLVKPMVVVTTSGYFVTIIGPYLADGRNSDARILTHMMQTNVEEIKSFVAENDVFIVDRGFRDSLAMLEDMGIHAEMPAFMQKGQKQMTTEDANTSRLVTKVRWVVESANARIKRWKYLDHVLPTTQVPFIGDFVRIVCAISNKYFPPLSATKNNDDDTALGRKMLDLSKCNNDLKIYIENHCLERKSACWKSAELDVEFPRLDEIQLRELTCGTYQLKMSAGYMQEHIDGNSDIYVHREDNTLLRVKIQSRHVSSKVYTLWIRHNATEVVSWYCKCRAGSRVVGVCAHVAAILWFLGYARHTGKEMYGTRNWGDYVLDAGNIPQTVDSSDTESE